MIEYRPVSSKRMAVKLDGKIVGYIRRVAAGFQYEPKGSHLKSETFAKLEDLKRSLESGDDDLDESDESDEQVFNPVATPR